MASFSVTDFKGSLGKGGGGARPSLYRINIDHSTDTTNLSFSTADNLLVKAASIPASNIAPLTVNYMGRAYKTPGFRTFDVWNVTVINDETFEARNRIQMWMRQLSGTFVGNRKVGAGDQYKEDGTIKSEGTAVVTQIGADGTDKQSWQFYNMWPTELGEVPLDWSSDAIEEYTIAFAYDYWSHGSSLEETTSVITVDTSSVG